MGRLEVMVIGFTVGAVVWWVAYLNVKVYLMSKERRNSRKES